MKIYFILLIIYFLFFDQYLISEINMFCLLTG